MTFLEDILDTATVGIGLLPLRMFADDAAEVVNYPFIDELFHVRQAQAYCDGDWAYWDPKITTPPGLYWLGALYNTLTSRACDLRNLRSINFMGCLSLALITFYLRRSIRNSGFTTLSVIMSPLITIYYALFYTDVWSAVFVLASYAVAITSPFGSDLLAAWTSALLGLLSLTFRQTNIVWTAFCMVALIDSIVQKKEEYNGKNFHQMVQTFLKTALSHWPLLVPYVLVAAFAVAFVVTNGGITLGDKENHQLSLHFMQLLYCATFIVGFTAPLWFSFSLLKDYVVSNFLTKRGLLFNAIWIPLLTFVIGNFTVIHPFVLADNRHYTFYIVRKLILRNGDPDSRFQLLPAYHFACYVIMRFVLQSLDSRSSSNSSLVAFFALIGSTALTIVPSPLFEPRYYILPMLLFRLLINPSFQPIIPLGWFRTNNKTIRLAFEDLWLWMWTQAIYIIFITYQFPWPTEENPQRIIW